MGPDDAPSGTVHSQDPEHDILIPGSWAVYPGLQRQVTLPDGASELGGHD